MRCSRRLLGVLIAFTVIALGCITTPAISAGGPADGYDLHVQAPHLMPDGTLGGPFHHYSKGISDTIFSPCTHEKLDHHRSSRMASLSFGASRSAQTLCGAKELKTIDTQPGHMRMDGRKPGEGGHLIALKQGQSSDERIFPGGRASGVELWEG